MSQFQNQANSAQVINDVAKDSSLAISQIQSSQYSLNKKMEDMQQSMNLILTSKDNDMKDLQAKQSEHLRQISDLNAMVAKLYQENTQLYAQMAKMDKEAKDQAEKLQKAEKASSDKEVQMQLKVQQIQMEAQKEVEEYKNLNAKIKEQYENKSKEKITKMLEELPPGAHAIVVQMLQKLGPMNLNKVNDNSNADFDEEGDDLQLYEDQSQVNQQQNVVQMDPSVDAQHEVLSDHSFEEDVQRYRPRGPSNCIISTFMDCFQSSFINPESRQIAQFTLVTCFFVGLEFVYAILAHSLTLLIDADHRLCDMTGLIISLIVIYVKKLNQHKKNKGWFIKNIESISGIGSGLLLQYMALCIFFKSALKLMRSSGNDMQQQQELEEDEILPLTQYNGEMIVVSIGGLLLNVLGLYLFKEDENAESCNQSYYALYLHTLADTLGSIGALLAAFLVRNFELYIADTICAFFTAITIFLSVIPLLKISFTNLTKSDSPPPKQAINAKKIN